MYLEPGHKTGLFFCPKATGIFNPRGHIIIPCTNCFPGAASLLGLGMSERDGRDGRGRTEVGVVTKTRPKTQKPPMYKVMLLNDDYTPMEFVVHVLERFFNKAREDATRIMLHVHQKGVGICGVFTYEVAETKVTQVIDFARQHQHPLQCTMERD
jgi:ATP-dependent Clp protease adaptor protein ClpS